MDIGTLRGLTTILVMVVFIGICWWAFSPKRKKQFEKAAHLPFDDDDQHKRTASKSDAEQSDDKNQ